MKRIMPIMLLLYAIPLTQAQVVIVPPAVILQPDNIMMPTSTGGLFSFDFVISSDPMGIYGQVFQSTISVSGPGTLTLDAASSAAVATVDDYWLLGNSGGAAAIDKGGNIYQFADDPWDAYAPELATNDIMARYAFTWDGTVGDYTFTLDLHTDNSFIVLDGFISYKALQLPDPVSVWWSDPIIDAEIDSFTVHIPEPTTLILLALGGMAVLRKRNA